jgi:hypothetical protein
MLIDPKPSDLCECGHTRHFHIRSVGCIHANEDRRTLQKQAVCACRRFKGVKPTSAAPVLHEAKGVPEWAQ